MIGRERKRVIVDREPERERERDVGRKRDGQMRGREGETDRMADR